MDLLRQFYQPIVEQKQLVNDLLKECNPCVSVQKRSTEYEDYHFVMNFSEENQVIYLQKTGKDLESGEEVTGTLTLAPYEVRVLVTEKTE